MVPVVWSRVLDEDFSRIPRDEFEPFHGKTVLVTGATGLVGSLIVKGFVYARETYGIDTRVMAVVRDGSKARRTFAPHCGQLDLVVCDLMHDVPKIDGEVDYIVHCAAITQSKLMVERPVDVIDLSVCGTRSVLGMAVQKRARMAYLSSMEVYGTIPGKDRVGEDQLGFIDLGSVRSCYPESKRLCENLCVAFAVQHGLDVSILRLAQTFGAGVGRTESRAVVQFARKAAAGDDIVLKTRGLSEGNYVYASDAVRAILLVLLKGEAREAYNVSNESTHMTIRELAHFATRVFPTRGSRVVIDVDEQNSSGYAADVRLFLDSSKLRRLGWEPQVDLGEAMLRTIAYLEEQDDPRED